MYVHVHAPRCHLLHLAGQKGSDVTARESTKRMLAIQQQLDGLGGLLIHVRACTAPQQQQQAPHTAVAAGRATAVTAGASGGGAAAAMVGGGSAPALQKVSADGAGALTAQSSTADVSRGVTGAHLRGGDQAAAGASTGDAECATAHVGPGGSAAAGPGVSSHPHSVVNTGSAVSVASGAAAPAAVGWKNTIVRDVLKDATAQGRVPHAHGAVGHSKAQVVVPRDKDAGRPTARPVLPMAQSDQTTKGRAAR